MLYSCVSQVVQRCMALLYNVQQANITGLYTLCNGMVTALLQLPAATINTVEYCSCLQVLQRLGFSR